MSAIRLKIKKSNGEHDLGVSKFLGKPTLPEELVNAFDETVLFLLQINLEEIKDLDKENKLPHKGYLYFFLDTADSEYSLKPIVKYYPGEPTVVIDDFNAMVPEYEEYVEEFLVEFEECDDYEAGHKLFGKPNDWNYAEESDELLLQFDPLEGDMGIFSHLDGLIYFFFGKDRKHFKDVKLMEEIS